MPNLVALGLMVSDKKIFKDFKKFSVLLPWQPEFLRNQIISRNSEEDHGGNISVKFHQNPISRVNARTHARTDGWKDGRRTTGHDISSLAYGQWS